MLQNALDYRPPGWCYAHFDRCEQDEHFCYKSDCFTHQTGYKKIIMRQRLEIWTHFDRQGNTLSAADKAKCRYCDYVASAQPKRLLKHLLVCSTASLKTQNRATSQNLTDSSVMQNTQVLPLHRKEVSPVTLNTQGLPLHRKEASTSKRPRNDIIEKVVKLRTNRGGTKEALVKWRGWSPRYNTWIAQRDLPNYS